jgi:DNA repair photolyase
MKSIEKRKITAGTREWADYTFNCIRGCYNDCRYCYAKTMAKRFNRTADGSWKRMKIRREILKKHIKKLPGRVMFPSTHDIFATPPFKDACFTILGRLLENGNEVLITTKPRLGIVKEICEEFGQYMNQMQFRFTITSIDDELLAFWEPNAPRFRERMDSLKYAFMKKFKTSVSIEPFLDYNPRELVEMIAPFITESIWIGRMNYIPRKIPSKKIAPFYCKIRRNYTRAHVRELYDDLKDHPKVRFKDSVRIQLGLEYLLQC